MTGTISPPLDIYSTHSCSFFLFSLINIFPSCSSNNTINISVKLHSPLTLIYLITSRAILIVAPGIAPCCFSSGSDAEHDLSSVSCQPVNFRSATTRSSGPKTSLGFSPHLSSSSSTSLYSTSSITMSSTDHRFSAQLNTAIRLPESSSISIHQPLFSTLTSHDTDLLMSEFSPVVQSATLQHSSESHVFFNSNCS